MSHSKTHTAETVDRRDFLKTGAAVVAAAAAGSGIVAAGEASPGPKPIAIRPFGKTGRELPILGYGGAALPKAWLNPLSTEDRVKLVRYAYDRGVRYFDTAGNYPPRRSATCSTTIGSISWSSACVSRQRWMPTSERFRVT